MIVGKCEISFKLVYFLYLFIFYLACFNVRYFLLNLLNKMVFLRLPKSSINNWKNLKKKTLRISNKNKN